MTDFLRNLPVPRRAVTAQTSSSPSAAALAGSFHGVINPSPTPASSLAVLSASSSSSSRNVTRGVLGIAAAKTSLLQTGGPAKIPPYGQRGLNHRSQPNDRTHSNSQTPKRPVYPVFIPRKDEDYDGGGAYPEIHVAQFPLDMGRNRTTSQKTVALQTGEDGRLEYDAIVKQGGAAAKLAVYSKPTDQAALYTPEHFLRKPDEEEEQKTIEKTRQALESIVDSNLSKGKVVKPSDQKPEFFKYTPNQQAPGHNANCAQRVVRMVDVHQDLMEPSRFRHKRVPAGPPSPPPPVQHSPPRKLTMKDQQEWKIPPSVSNWKNQKGYTIPLDKRLQADGRGLQDVTVNDKFAALSESLYIAERSAREEIRIRNELLKQKKAKEEEVREEKLRELAAKARADRSNIMNQRSSEGDDRRSKDEIEREEKERERKRELQRDLRLEKAGKKSKRNRDEDRDISEKIALGQPQPSNQETLYDSRLFNQSGGIGSGFQGGEDDSYNFFDRPLFTDRSAAASIYQHSRERFAESLGGDSLNLPSFSGAEKGTTRTAPVEFEKETADPFGLDTLLSEAKKK